AGVDEHDRAVGGLKRREGPVAAAGLGDGLGERLAVIEETAGHGDVTIFVARGRDIGPCRVRRRRARRSVDAMLDAVDQREFPCATLDLTDAEPDQDDDAGKREDREPRRANARFAARTVLAVVRRSSAVHYIRSICWAGIGIMLPLRWFMTHTEPDIAITTITMVKISAIMLQPFSDLGLMCRK